MSKKTIITGLLFVILLVAIPLSLYLVKQQQVIRSRADFIPRATFVDENRNPITQTASRRVKLRITKELAQERPGPTSTNTTLQVKMMMI